MFVFFSSEREEQGTEIYKCREEELKEKEKKKGKKMKEKTLALTRKPTKNKKSNIQNKK